MGPPILYSRFLNSTNLNSGSNPVHYLRSLSDVSNYVRSLCVYESDLYAGSNKLISIWNIDTMKIKRQITIPGEVFTLHIIKGMIHTNDSFVSDNYGLFRIYPGRYRWKTNSRLAKWWFKRDYLSIERSRGYCACSCLAFYWR